MLNQQLLMELEHYLNRRQGVLYSFKYSLEESLTIQDIESELNDFIQKRKKPTFHELLFKFIDRNGLTDPDVYKKAGLDRKHFSKIRSNPSYRPKKNTVFALILALQLNKKDAIEILNACGYSFSDSETTDLIIQFFIDKKIFDIQEVNETLEYFEQKPLSV